MAGALTFPDPPLSEGAVILRPWTAADIAWVVAACRDPEVSRYSPTIPFPYTEADARGWFASHEPARLSGAGLEFAVVQRDGGACLGAIGIILRGSRTAETGYWLSAPARGGGHMTSAVRALARWAFSDLRLARLWLTTDPENVASQRVAARCGFRREGHLRSHLIVRHSGQRRDALVWGLLPGELTEPGG